MGEIATLLPVVSVIKTQEHRLAKLGCQPLTEAVLIAAAEQHRSEAQQYLDQDTQTNFGPLARAHLGHVRGLDLARCRVVARVLGLTALEPDWEKRYPLLKGGYYKDQNDQEIFRYMRLIDADLTSVTP